MLDPTTPSDGALQGDAPPARTPPPSVLATDEVAGTPGSPLHGGGGPARPTAWERALHRRVPQILGLYLGAATSAVLFAEFLTTRYALSPYLVDVLLAAAVLALPAVAVLAYAHGAPGHQRWSWRQVAALGLNGLVGLGVLAAAFWGKPLGATTETVTVETADGETIQRTVARAAFRKRVVVADFDGDLGRAAAYALSADLDQDLFVSSYQPRALRRKLRQSGFESTAEAPLALLLDATKDGQFNFLLTGEVVRTERGVRVEAALHDPENPGQAERFSLEGPELTLVLDQVSARVQTAMGLPEARDVDDRAIGDHLTASVEALRIWADGSHTLSFEDNQQEAALATLRRAVALDTTFARAHVDTGFVLQSLSRDDQARAAFGAAQRHRYRLPEPLRFAVDTSIAYLEQRPDDALAIVRDWVTLVPDDVIGHQYLASLLASRDDMDGAIEAVEQLVDLDPGNPIRLYTLARYQGIDLRLEAARETIGRYIEAVPDDGDGPVLLAGVLLQLGDTEGAVEASRQAQRLDPGNSSYKRATAHYQLVGGDFDGAEGALRRVATQSNEPSDRAAALNQIAHLYDVQGRYQEAAATLDEYWTVLASYAPPVTVLTSQVGEGYHYTRAGRTELFEKALRETMSRPEIQASPRFRGSVASNAAWAYSQLGETDRVLELTATADSIYSAFGFEAGLPYVRAVRGVAYLNRGDYAEAIRLMAPHAIERPTDHFRVLPLAEAYVRGGDGTRAAGVAEQILVSFPAHPGAHWVLARVAASQDRPDAARRHVDAALEGWADADPDFGPAKRARALRQRLAAG